MDRYLKDSTSYNTLRSQTHLGGNGSAAVQVKVIEGLLKDLSNGPLFKDSASYDTLRNLTLVGKVPLLFQSKLLKVFRKTFSNGLLFKRRLHVV
jgi:hypothetical protein